MEGKKERRKERQTERKKEREKERERRKTWQGFFLLILGLLCVCCLFVFSSREVFNSANIYIYLKNKTKQNCL